MRVKLFTFRFSPTLGAFDDGPLLDFVRDKEVLAFREHFFTVAFVNSGFNHLVRPMMYGAKHPIRNVTRPQAPPERVAVAGNLCESGDHFAKNRDLPSPHEGDVFAIGVAGAYGYSMASTYNPRDRPVEVLLYEDGPAHVVRRRESPRRPRPPRRLHLPRRHR